MQACVPWVYPGAPASARHASRRSTSRRSLVTARGARGTAQALRRSPLSVPLLCAQRGGFPRRAGDVDSPSASHDEGARYTQSAAQPSGSFVDSAGGQALWSWDQFVCRHCYRLAILPSVKIATIGHCGGPTILARELAASRAASVFPGRPRGMHRQTYERLKSAVFNAEILAEEQLVILLGRLQRSDRPRERRSADRPYEFWT